MLHTVSTEQKHVVTCFLYTDEIKKELCNCGTLMMFSFVDKLKSLINLRHVFGLSKAKREKKRKDSSQATEL